MNRIASAVERMEQTIQSRNLPQSKIDELNRQMDIGFDEYVIFQDRKSLAHASGTLTLEEAQVVYSALGSGPEHFNKQPLPMKLVVTQLMSELFKVS